LRFKELFMEKSKLKKKKRLPLWGKVLIGLAIGVAAGLIAPKYAEQLKPIGTIFINLVKMLIVPLVFSSLMVGMTSVKDLKKVGRLGLKVFSFYLVTTALAVILGLILCWLTVQIFPLSGMGPELSDAAAEAVKKRSISEILIGLIPTNPIKAMADGNVLQIIVFAVFLGLACNLAGEKSKALCEFCDNLCNAMIKLTGIIMEAAPVGVFALIAWTVSKYGGSSLKNLMLLVFIVYAGCIIQMVFVFGGSLILLARLNPLKFFKGSFDPIVLAFSASSSSAALPVSMRCAEDNLGVSNSVVSFSLPLGSTINMDGTAIYQGVCAMFVAQAWGIDLSIGQCATIVLTSCLGAIGTAGIPGAGLIMLTLVLSSVGLPLEAIGVIAGVDRLLDMARTAVNVCGDLVAATSVVDPS
jgi:Na+/H+-dicarboxylate symporter